MKYIIGIDEVGRGPLAGPIVAAAVVYQGKAKQKKVLSQVKDSKILKQAQREELFLQIIQNFYWSASLLDNQMIDRYGIQAANYMVVHDLVEELENKFLNQCEFRADYVAGADKLIPQCLFYKKGESLFKEIAAASIVAKVWRDRMMLDCDHRHPKHQFSIHKGYGTKNHFALIKKFGPTDLHRRSFLRKYFSTADKC